MPPARQAQSPIAFAATSRTSALCLRAFGRWADGMSPAGAEPDCSRRNPPASGPGYYPARVGDVGPERNEAGKMELGVVFPQTEIGSDPSVVRDYAQAAEQLGYHHLATYDHVLGGHPDRFQGAFRPPYTHETSFHEPFVLFGYLAALTTRLELVTGILILPQRQTALVAKQAAEVDLLSGGRLRLGVGLGWNFVEYEALGERFQNRGARIEEQIQVLLKLWSEELVDFQGKYHTIKQASIQPRPAHRIPIWMGGTADAVLRRVARLADGWFPQAAPGPELAEMLERLRRYVREAGRPE